MSILVTGSMAYDYIMDFPGRFSDHILPEKVHMLSVSFLVRGLKRNRGGVAGNVAHNVRLLGGEVGIFGTVGHDAGEYRAWLTARGIDVRHLYTIDDEFTASCFITTDQSNNQITGFYPGAMAACGGYSLTDVPRDLLDLVIITPNDPAGMARYPTECRQLQVPYIYSPAQQIVTLGAEELRDGVAGAAAVVGNDYEFEMIQNKTGLSVGDLVKQCGLVVVTMGERGSLMRTPTRELQIPVAPAHGVVDPTGAGDAYTAGLAVGLARGYSLEVTGRLAALAAVYAVETYGTQNHAYTRAEFAARFASAFGDTALPEDLQPTAGERLAADD